MAFAQELLLAVVLQAGALQIQEPFIHRQYVAKHPNYFGKGPRLLSSKSNDANEKTIVPGFHLKAVVL
jgi:hypothetical protein